MHTKNFDELLLEAIDEALSSLGESPKTAIYFHVEAKFGISREQIPRRLEDFSSSLEKLFGSGARYLEIMFMRQLSKKCKGECELNNPTLTFQGYVQIKKRNFREKDNVEIGALTIAETEKERCILKKKPSGGK